MHFILELSWLQWGLIAIALAALYLLRKRINRLYVRLMKPSRDRKARWQSLATVDDVNESAEDVKMSSKSLIESMVDKLLTKLVEKLPGVISEELIDRVVSGIPDAIEEQMRGRVSSLMAQVKTLRAERDKLNNEWIPVPVRVNGFKVSENDDEKNYFAFVMLNRRTGEIRAAFNKGDRRIVPYGEGIYDYSPSRRLKVGMTSGHPIGAPWYNRVEGDPKKLVMLGETYWVG